MCESTSDTVQSPWWTPCVNVNTAQCLGLSVCMWKQLNSPTPTVYQEHSGFSVSSTWTGRQEELGNRTVNPLTSGRPALHPEPHAAPLKYTYMEHFLFKLCPLFIMPLSVSYTLSHFTCHLVVIFPVHWPAVNSMSVFPPVHPAGVVGSGPWQQWPIWSLYLALDLCPLPLSHWLNNNRQIDRQTGA